MTTRLTLLLALLLVLVGCRARSPHRRHGGVSPVYSAHAGSKRTAPVRSTAHIESPAVRVGAPLVSLDLEGASLHDAVEILRSSTGINIIVSPLVDEVHTSDELLVSLRVNDVTVGTALDWITRLLRLQWYTENGVVFVTVPGDAPREPDRRIYSVHDLLNPLTNSN